MIYPPRFWNEKSLKRGLTGIEKLRNFADFTRWEGNRLYFII